jgi:hypothetical protein
VWSKTSVKIRIKKEIFGQYLIYFDLMNTIGDITTTGVVEGVGGAVICRVGCIGWGGGGGGRGRGVVKSILLFRIFPEIPTLACHLRGAFWITLSCRSCTRLDLRGASAENGQIPAFENPALM